MQKVVFCSGLRWCLRERGASIRCFWRVRFGRKREKKERGRDVGAAFYLLTLLLHGRERDVLLYSRKICIILSVNFRVGVCNRVFAWMTF